MVIVQGTVDLTVNTINSKGQYQSSYGLCGRVRNGLGKLVDSLTLDHLTETARGRYQLLGYDISDPVKFPGSRISVFWSTIDVDLSPETPLVEYNHMPTHPTGYKHRMFTWRPSSDKHLYGYQIERKLASEVEYSIVGFAEFPYYFDPATYTSVNQARGAIFRATELRWQTDTEDGPITGEQCANICLSELREDVCILGGFINNVMGSNAKVESLHFYVHHKDGPMFLDGSAYVKDNEITAQVNNYGAFSIPLVRGLLVAVDAPDVGLRGKFVVPDQPDACLADLEIIQFDLHRAQ